MQLTISAPTGPRSAQDVSIRYVICASSSSLGLALEIQTLPGHAATLNTHNILNKTSSPAVLITSIPLSTNFFREEGLYGPKPTIFVLGDKEEFAQNLSSAPERFCSGKGNNNKLMFSLID